MAATIRDIARKAGVSPATVSLVLNGKPGVGDRTRELVLQTAEGMNYRGVRKKKSASERSVRLLKIPRHGHILNRDHQLFVADYIDGVEYEAGRLGYRLEVQTVDSFKPDEIGEFINGSPADGTIILATELMLEDFSAFESVRRPLVFMDALHPSAPFDFVDMDNEGAIFSVVKTLKDMGHGAAGLISSSMETRNFRAREKSFREAVGFYGMEFREEWHFRADSAFESSVEDLEGQFRREQQLPGVLFCVSDIIALAALRALKGKGFSIPGDISLVGFDNLPSCEIAEPPLTSVNVSKRMIGRRAFQLLHNRMTDREHTPFEKVLVGSSLIVRESLASPSTS